MNLSKGKNNECSGWREIRSGPRAIDWSAHPHGGREKRELREDGRSCVRRLTGALPQIAGTSSCRAPRAPRRCSVRSVDAGSSGPVSLHVAPSEKGRDKKGDQKRDSKRSKKSSPEGWRGRGGRAKSRRHVKINCHYIWNKKSAEPFIFVVFYFCRFSLSITSPSSTRSHPRDNTAPSANMADAIY